MLEWYNSIHKLTEAPATERDAFIVRATSQRTAGGRSARVRSQSDVSDDIGLENDEADEVPYSGQPSAAEVPEDYIEPPRRPEAGRFPSDLHTNRDGDNQSERSITPEPDHGRYAAGAAAAAGTTYAGYNYANRQDDQPPKKPVNYDDPNNGGYGYGQQTAYGQQHPQEQATYGQTAYGQPNIENTPSGPGSQYGAYGDASRSDYTQNTVGDGDRNLNFVPVVVPGHGNNNRDERGVVGSSQVTGDNQVRPFCVLISSGL